MEPVFFERAEAFRDWLEANHETATEVWVGFYRVGSGRPSMTYPEAVDQALCYGWIDGIRKRLDELSYVNRFTPRKPDSAWSEVNVGRVEELTRQGLMRPAGLRAFERRQATGVYSYEAQRQAALDPEYERRLRADPAAWEFFQSQPPWYRRTAAFWVMSAKKEETRLKRLATLISDSAAGRTIRVLTRPARSGE